jgi:tetratricopeptide (TPR) repeat protein
MLEQAGMFEPACLEYRLVVLRDPGSLAGFEGLRRTAALAGREDTLIQVSRVLIEAHPKEFEYRLGLMQGLLAMQRRSEALAEARRAESEWPGRTPSIAEALAQGGALAEAVDYYLRGRARAGDSSAFDEQLLDLHERMGDSFRAAGELVRLLNRDSANLMAMLPRIAELASRLPQGQLLGVLANISKPAARARAQAEVYLALGRGAEAVRLMKSTVSRGDLLEFGRYCESTRRLEQALEVYSLAGAPVDRSRVLRKLGRVEEAAALLGQLQDPAARVELGDLRLFTQRDYADAARLYREVLRVQPTREEVVRRLAASEMGLGQLDAAAARLDKLPTPSDSALLLLTKIQLFRHKPDSARAAVGRLAARHPLSPLLNDALQLALVADTTSRAMILADAIHALEIGDNDAAVTRARRLTAGADVVAELALLTAADALGRAKKPRDAVEQVDRYLATFDRGRLRPQALLQKALLLRDGLGDTAGYRAQLRELVVAFPGSPCAPVARAMLEAGNASPAGGIR